jgi:hypothetical protein
VDYPETPRVHHRKIGGASEEKGWQIKKPKKSSVISLRSGSFKAGAVVR